MKNWFKTEGHFLDADWPSQPFGEEIEKLVLAGRITEAVEFCLLVQQVVAGAMVQGGISEFAAITDKYEFKIADLAGFGSGLLVDLGQDLHFQWLFSKDQLPRAGSVSA